MYRMRLDTKGAEGRSTQMRSPLRWTRVCSGICGDVEIPIAYTQARQSRHCPPERYLIRPFTLSDEISGIK